MPDTPIVTVLVSAEIDNGGVGDWDIDDGIPYGRTIRVAALSDRRHQIILAVHELIESEICRYLCIRRDEVSAFDKRYEQTGGEGEPGDDPLAPYYRAHVFATNIERLLAAEIGVKWSDYEDGLERAAEDK